MLEAKWIVPKSVDLMPLQTLFSPAVLVNKVFLSTNSTIFHVKVVYRTALKNKHLSDFQIEYNINFDGADTQRSMFKIDL